MAFTHICVLMVLMPMSALSKQPPLTSLSDPCLSWNVQGKCGGAQVCRLVKLPCNKPTCPPKPQCGPAPTSETECPVGEPVLDKSLSPLQCFPENCPHQTSCFIGPLGLQTRCCWVGPIAVGNGGQQ